MSEPTRPRRALYVAICRECGDMLTEGDFAETVNEDNVRTFAKCLLCGTDSAEIIDLDGYFVRVADYDRDVGEKDRTIGDLVARSQQDYERITHLQQHIEGLTKANRALHDEVATLKYKGRP